MRVNVKVEVMVVGVNGLGSGVLAAVANPRARLTGRYLFLLLDWIANCRECNERCVDGSQRRTLLRVCSQDELSRVLPTANVGKCTNSSYSLVEVEVMVLTAQSLEDSTPASSDSRDEVE